MMHHPSGAVFFGVPGDTPRGRETAWCPSARLGADQPRTPDLEVPRYTKGGPRRDRRRSTSYRLVSVSRSSKVSQPGRASESDGRALTRPEPKIAAAPDAVLACPLMGVSPASTPAVTTADRRQLAGGVR